MTVAEYKAKWGLPNDYPTTAPAYSEARSAMAKALGLARAAASTPRARARADRSQTLNDEGTPAASLFRIRLQQAPGCPASFGLVDLQDLQRLPGLDQARNFDRLGHHGVHAGVGVERPLMASTLAVTAMIGVRGRPVLRSGVLRGWPCWPRRRP